MTRDLPLVEASFRAMGSDCRIVCDLDNDALFNSVHRIEDLESRWSRFRPDSEISRCNSSPGDWTEVSAITSLLIERAMQASRRTNGLFNPLLLGRLEQLGYDRSFEQLILTDGSSPGYAATHEWRSTSAGAIELDAGAVRLPVGAKLDPGGLGKGLAADLVCADLTDAGATWVTISLGGDLRMGGAHLEATGCQVNVEDPSSPGKTIRMLEVRGGAIATSSTLKRRWIKSGSDSHHLIDPRTGNSARTRRATVTATAEEAWWADVVAKCLIVDDCTGVDELIDWDAAAFAFTNDGRVEDLGLELRQPIVH